MKIEKEEEEKSLKQNFISSRIFRCLYTTRQIKTSNIEKMSLLFKKKKKKFTHNTTHTQLFLLFVFSFSLFKQVVLLSQIFFIVLFSDLYL